MSDPTDRRVRRTKKALTTALLELMVEKGYERTSIQDVVDRADLGRSTFYSHYVDKEDLLKQSVESLGAFLRTAKPEHGDNPAISLSRPMLIHLSEMRPLSSAMLADANLGVAYRHMRDMLGDIVRENLEESSDLPADVVVEFVVASFLAVVSWWLSKEPGRSPEEIHEIFSRLVSPSLGSGSRTAHARS